MSEISEAFIVVGVAIVIVMMGFLGMFLIGNQIYLKHKKYDFFSECVRVDAVCGFLSYLNVKIETKRYSILRVVSSKEERHRCFSYCNILQKKIPTFQDLIKSKTPLLIENFLSKEDIKFLTLEQ